MIQVFTDGASRGNPGPASIGAVCFSGAAPSLEEFKKNENDAKIVFTISEQIGKATNNEAEYTSLIKAVEALLKKDINEAIIFMDSELVIRQINGVYKVKSKSLFDYFQKVKKLCEGKNFTFKHITRDKNKIADYLANQAYKNG